jgi:DNA repair photolyase
LFSSAGFNPLDKRRRSKFSGDVATGSHGRGAAQNPPNRFERIEVAVDPESQDSDEPSPKTQFFKETARTIVATNDSPDVGFDASINPYRGCEHGCVYCYARPTHEYAGFSAGLDFETKILVKQDAPDLLRRELSSPRWTPRTIAISGVTDAYQPIERRLGITRRCLEVLAEFCNPVAIVTKNFLVTRDADLLKRLAEIGAAAVYVSVTTLDPALAGAMEPRASTPARRLEAIEILARERVPVGVMVAPVIPALTDAELPSIVAAAARAGARFGGFIPLRLPHGVADLFADWLERRFPARKKKVLARIRAIRGGRLNDPRFGSRMEGEGIFAEQIEALFRTACRTAGISEHGPTLSAAAFRRPPNPQLSLFG